MYTIQRKAIFLQGQVLKAFLGRVECYVILLMLWKSAARNYSKNRFIAQTSLAARWCFDEMHRLSQNNIYRRAVTRRNQNGK